MYPRLVAAEHGSAYRQEPLPSGIDALDALMGGGIDRGTSTLLIGPPGSGKSTLALQYAAAALARGDHAATFVFDETKSALLSRSAGIGIGLPEGSGPEQLAIRQIDPVAISPGEFAHLVRQSVERDGARVVIIDSLNGYLNSMPQNSYLTAQLHELLSYLGNTTIASGRRMPASTGTLPSQSIPRRSSRSYIDPVRMTIHPRSVKRESKSRAAVNPLTRECLHLSRSHLLGIGGDSGTTDPLRIISCGAYFQLLT